MFEIQERIDPIPGPREVLVRTSGAGINRADILQREGKYPAPEGAPEWPGLEASGTVVAVGAEVLEYAAGDEVCALLTGGGYASLFAAPEELVIPAPKGVPLVEAGGLVEAACTVWSNLAAARAKSGETLLVHGGSGGIGTTAIQIGKAIGMTVVATARGPERTARCANLGADVAVDYETENFVPVVSDLGGADVILDVVGAAYLERNLETLTQHGRLVIIGLQGGSTANLDLGMLMRKGGTVLSNTLRARPFAEKAAIVAATRQNVWPLIPSEVRPIVHGTYPLAEASRAHTELESGRVFGKLILTVE